MMAEISNPTEAQSIKSSERPYRSHKIPACQFCRRRKSRCTRDTDGNACHLCILHGVECSTASNPLSYQKQAINEKRKRPASRDHGGRSSGVTSRADGAEAVSQPARLEVAASSAFESSAQNAAQLSNTHSGHIIGPAAARDAQVLEQYISSSFSRAVSHARPNPYSVYSDDPRDPVVYMKVPRHRIALPVGNGTCGFKQYETMEKIFDPLGPELFNLYFEKVHPAFPILDEKTVLEAYRQDGLPYTIVCEILGLAIVYWSCSSTIQATRRPPPDVRYIWHQVVGALHEEFQAPSFSTVLASILDLTGRPITSVTYNAISLGRTIALSQSLGLNRNPTAWNLDQRQKSLRIRTWWGILVHDRWASLAHGTPPLINERQYDVPLPDTDTFLPSPSSPHGVPPHDDIHLKGSRAFVAFCQLSEILGQLLPLIYDLVEDRVSCHGTLLQTKTMLSDWENALPIYLQYCDAGFERNAPGSLSLHLSLLAVKMCMSRISLQAVTKDIEGDRIEPNQHLQSDCRKAAQAVVDFTLALKPTDFNVFWIPYTAYHFTSTVTLMLRCALEAETDDIANECISSAKNHIEFLRCAKNTYNFDLAEICLAQCETVVQQISSDNFQEFRRRNARPTLRPKISYATHHAISPQVSRDNAHPTTSPFAGSSNLALESEIPETSTNSGVNLQFFDLAGMEDNHTLDTTDYLFDYSSFPDLWQLPHMDFGTSYTPGS